MKRIFCVSLLTALLSSALTINAISEVSSNYKALPAPVLEPVASFVYEPELDLTPVDLSVTEPEVEKHIEQAVITHYCPCAKCCGQWSCEILGGDPITASGTVATAGRTVGYDPNLIPYGTHIWIDGHEYVVEDTGSGLTKGMLHIDIFCNTHAEALRLGKRYAEVSWEEAP